MHDDNLSYAKTFYEALYGLFEKGQTTPQVDKDVLVERTFDQLVKEANNAFESYLSALGNKDFDRASEQLKTLAESLRQLSGIHEPNKPEAD